MQLSLQRPKSPFYSLPNLGKGQNIRFSLYLPTATGEAIQLHSIYSNTPLNMTQKSSLSRLVPVMFAFFTMGFVDLVGIATN